MLPLRAGSILGALDELKRKSDEPKGLVLTASPKNWRALGLTPVPVVRIIGTDAIGRT